MALHESLQSPGHGMNGNSGTTGKARWKPEEDADNPLYREDNFRMYCLKVLPCSKRYCHDWVTCPFAHAQEKARRRDPRLWNYTGVACPETRRNVACPRGDQCPFAHNVFEYWLHHSRYRTQLCNDGVGCKRKICFFAHTLDELRVSSVKVQGVPGEPADNCLNPFAAPSPTAGGRGARGAASRAHASAQPPLGPSSTSPIANDMLSLAELQQLNNLRTLLQQAAGVGADGPGEPVLMPGATDRASLDHLVAVMTLAQQQVAVGAQRGAMDPAIAHLLQVQQMVLANQMQVQAQQEAAAAAVAAAQKEHAVALAVMQMQQQMAAMQLMGRGDAGGPAGGQRGPHEDPFAAAMNGGMGSLFPTATQGFAAPGGPPSWAPAPPQGPASRASPPSALTAAMIESHAFAGDACMPHAPPFLDNSYTTDGLSHQLSSLSASTIAEGLSSNLGPHGLGPDPPLSARSFSQAPASAQQHHPFLGGSGDFRRQATAPAGGIPSRPARFSMDAALHAALPRLSAVGSERSASAYGGYDSGAAAFPMPQAGFPASKGPGSGGAYAGLGFNLGAPYQGTQGVLSSPRGMGMGAGPAAPQHTSPISISALGDGYNSATGNSLLSHNSLSSHEEEGHLHD